MQGRNNTNLKHFHKIDKEVVFPYNFYKDNIVLSQNLTETSHTHTHTQYNNRLTSLINMDMEVLNTVLASQIQQYVKTILYHDQSKFTLGMQGWLALDNQST